MDIVSEFKPCEKEINFLEQEVFNFNCSKVENYAYENFVIKALSDSKSLSAGIHGQIGGGWLCIQSLWVIENQRGQGIGKKLLFLAEETALKRNCYGSYLYTYSFQSPKFYEKYGYRVFGTLEDFCGNHTKYFLKKNWT